MDYTHAEKDKQMDYTHAENTQRLSNISAENRQRIEAARQVGVAFAKNQPQRVTKVVIWR